MVRTKAGSVSNKAIGAKAPQKVTITAILSGNAPKTKHTGGNPYHPRETPGWQKPITFFMKQDGESSKDESIEIEDLPGLPGIRGDVISPKASGSKRKPKERKPQVEKKVKSKKQSKKSDAAEDVDEKPKSNKKKDRSDVDVDQKSKKKRKKEAANDSEMEVDDESKDDDEAAGEKENYNSNESDVNMEDESAGENGSQSKAKKNVRTNSKDKEKSDMLNPEETEIEIKNKDTAAPNCISEKNQETDEEIEKKIQKIEGTDNDDSLTDDKQNEPESIENIDEDEASETI